MPLLLRRPLRQRQRLLVAPIVPSGPDLVIPLPELTGPPGPQQSPPIEYRGNAGIREASQVRGKRTSKGHVSRIPHTAKGTPSIPPEEAVGAYRSDSPDRSTAAQSQDQRAQLKGSSDDRSRSRDPPGEGTPVVPIPRPQAVMSVPEYLLPIMASAGVGHLSLDQPKAPVGVEFHHQRRVNLVFMNSLSPFTQAQDRMNRLGPSNSSQQSC